MPCTEETVVHRRRLYWCTPQCFRLASNRSNIASQPSPTVFLSEAAAAFLLAPQLSQPSTSTVCLVLGAAIFDTNLKSENWDKQRPSEANKATQIVFPLLHLYLIFAHRVYILQNTYSAIFTCIILVLFKCSIYTFELDRITALCCVCVSVSFTSFFSGGCCCWSSSSSLPSSPPPPLRHSIACCNCMELTEWICCINISFHLHNNYSALANFQVS